MDHLKELEKKLGGYLAMQDWPWTWSEIYTDGGMDLIREYSRRLAPEGMDEKKYEYKIIARYWIGAGQAAESEAEILRLIDDMPVRHRADILKNPLCTERIIEMLWVGNYVHYDDRPFPELAVAIAFFNHYYKVLAIFARRPDLRDLPEYLLDLIMAGLELEGMTIDTDESKISMERLTRAN